MSERKLRRRKALTIPPRAIQILQYVEAFKAEYDFSPSRREMMGLDIVAGVNPIENKILSTSVCNYYIKFVLMERLGFIEENAGDARTIHITLKGKLFLQTLRGEAISARDRDLLNREKEVAKLLCESGLAHLVDTKIKTPA